MMNLSPEIPPEIPTHHRHSPMRLITVERPDYQEKEVGVNLTAVQVEGQVKQLSWQTLTFVVCQLDEQNWLEGSGSLDPADGLSARCMVEGSEFVSADAPDSLETIIDLLQSFMAKDGRWRTKIEWS